MTSETPINVLTSKKREAARRKVRRFKTAVRELDTASDTRAWSKRLDVMFNLENDLINLVTLGLEAGAKRGRSK